ncbi:MAG: M36 family metallopeptidase [Polyangiaceae bacterium]
MSRRIRPLAALALVLASCAPADPPPASAPGAPSATPEATAPAVPRVTPAFDQRSAQPRFGWGNGAIVRGTPEARSMDVVRAIAPTYGLSEAAIRASAAARVFDHGRGGSVVEVAQSVDGVDVLHARLKLLFDRDGRLVAAGGRLAPDVSIPKGPWKLDARAAVAVALTDAGLSVSASEVTPKGTRRGAYDDYTAPALTTPARARAVWLEGDRGLLPGFELEVFARVGDRDVASRYVVSGDTGEIVGRVGLVQHAPFKYRVWADSTGDHRPADGPQADYTPHPTGAPDGSAPAFVPPSLVSIDGFNVHQDPWLAANATETKGNNVDAYTDAPGVDGFSPGDVRASTTANGAFDRTYDLFADPLANDTQRMASVTEAFYTTNWLHDDWYDAGFDEKAGNAQASNYGRGGAENDPLLVEVQDEAPNKLDNANAQTPADGESPRIQIYLWSPKTDASITWAGGTLVTGSAQFGALAFELTGALALANDGTSVTSDACEPLVDNVVGKIVLVDRGSCPFKQKAVNVEAAGGVGTIVVNNQPGGAPYMPEGPPNTPVTIPVQSITQADGNALKNALMTGPVTVTMHNATAPLIDGALDNLIVAHEWGHYLHHRLTHCENSQCGAESEGWGDFVALHMAVRPGDALAGTFASSTFAALAIPDSAYFGVRRYPYSTDLTKNPLTLKHIAAGEPLPAGVPVSSSAITTNNEVHAAGEVWASMLWEGYAAMLAAATGPNPPYTFAEARKRMAQYVVAGMQLAPAEPTYTEQRDAILAAASASDPADALLIAQGFAKRGAGSCAIAPPRESTDFTGVVESYVIAPRAAITSVAMAEDLSSCDHDGYLDDDEVGHVIIGIENASLVPLEGATLTLTSSDPAITFANATVPVGTMGAFASTSIAVPVTNVKSTSGTVQITAKVHAPMACEEDLEATEVFPISSDAVPSAIDHVETLSPTWTLLGDGAATTWSRELATGTNHVWHAKDLPGISDRSLVSAPIQVASTGSFVFSFLHAHQFEASMGTFYDAGVVEISTDGGASWKDISMYATPTYGGPISMDASNPLGGQNGYVGETPGFPAMVKETLDLGSKFAGQTVQLRFRVGTDMAAGAAGWFIDDIEVTGATNAPFNDLAPDMCEPSMTSSSASMGSSVASTGSGAGGAGGGGDGNGGDGCGCEVGAGAPSSALALAASGLLAVGARRRRRRSRRES